MLEYFYKEMVYSPIFCKNEASKMIVGLKIDQNGKTLYASFYNDTSIRVVDISDSSTVDFEKNRPSKFVSNFH